MALWLLNAVLFTIAIDMSPAYQKGVRENFGNAQIAFDKFQVVSQVVMLYFVAGKLEVPYYG
jgi:hypothetical protein